MVIYFTGTGNSRWCAQMIANRLDGRLLNAFSFIRDGVPADLFSEKPWVFVSPTYGWQIPHVFADFLRAARFEGSRDAYFVMTCGSEIGNAGAGIRALCAEKGLRFKGVLQVVMPENYIALFHVPDREEARQTIDASLPTVEAGIACIHMKEDFPPHKAVPLDRLKSGPINAVFYRFVVKAKAFYSTNSCVGCGKCEKVCVLQNIRLRDGRPVWGGRCTHCMACICGCPVEAIEYGKNSLGKPRYQCPEFQD